MGWQILHISRPAHLSLKHRQCTATFATEETVSIPVEELAVLVLENHQITVSAALLQRCAAAGVAVFVCSETHTPNGVLLPFLSHFQTAKMAFLQINVSAPFKNRIWQQLVKNKILGQSTVLKKFHYHTEADKLKMLADYVTSGDPANREGQAAALYWQTLYGRSFTRNTENSINAALNYSYAILRGMVARDIVSVGFLPCFGVHHNNQLNAFNLADDLIEIFRPIADETVYSLYVKDYLNQGLTPNIKSLLLSILTRDFLYYGQEKNVLVISLDVCRSLSQAVESKTAQLFKPFVYL